MALRHSAAAMAALVVALPAGLPAQVQLRPGRYEVMAEMNLAGFYKGTMTMTTDGTVPVLKMSARRVGECR